MSGLKILNSRAILALVLATAAPAASLAEFHGGKGSSGAVRAGFHAGKGYHGGSARRFGGGMPAARSSADDAGYRGTFIPGSVVGAVGFYDNGYYENGYYEDGPVAIVRGSRPRCRRLLHADL